MKAYLGVILLCIFSMWACKPTPAPMTTEQLQAILKDIYIAEVAARFNDSLMQLNKQADTPALIEAYAKIYAKHNITGEALREALIWYQDNPILLDTVYRRVMDTFSNWRTANIRRDSTTFDSLKNSLRPELIKKPKTTTDE